jgi:hypothetical protein
MSFSRCGRQVRDALRRGGCNASRASLVGACVAASAVSCGWSHTAEAAAAGDGAAAADAAATVMGGVPLAWVERVWCAGRALPLIGALGRVRAELAGGERSPSVAADSAKL